MTKETDSLSLKRNKNIVYFICNNFYEDLLQTNLDLIYQYTDNVDTCCIVPVDFVVSPHNVQPTHYLKVNDFDFRYSAKFIISKWELAQNYDNFLYLDVDAIPTKSLTPIFELIEQQKDIIHGVREKKNLNSCDQYHKFSEIQYSNVAPAFNAGTFGFNKHNLNIFNVLLEYINSVRSRAYIDQAIFNEFFTSLNNIQPTLSEYVYLFNKDGCYDDINNITAKEARIIHFLGNAYGGKDVDYIKRILNNV